MGSKPSETKQMDPDKLSEIVKVQGANVRPEVRLEPEVSITQVVAARNRLNRDRGTQQRGLLSRQMWSEGKVRSLSRLLAPAQLRLPD